MQTKIVIRHIAGTKRSQIDMIPLTEHLEISLGRDPGSTVQFDPDKDDVVSRKHAVIKATHHGNSFVLTDSGSTHGTFLNGKKVAGEEILAPGDEIELGRGVKISFDIDPRPAHMVGRTRALNTIDPAVKATSALKVAQGGQSQPMPAPPGTPLTRTQPDATPANVNPVLFAVFAVVLASVVGGAAYYVSTRKAEPIATAEAETPKVTELTTEAIAEKLSKSTVYIEVKWQAIDGQTGQPVYHKNLKISNELKLPLYIETKSAGVVPWLTIDDENGVNVAIGSEGSGSGFVVNESGFILTNKHVATGWQLPYSNVPTQAYLVPQGATVEAIYSSISKDRVINLASSPAASRLASWVPASGGILFEPNRAVPIGNSVRDFNGRNEILQLQFANSKQPIDAQLVRFSSEADVAVIKIDSPEPLQPIQLSEHDEVNLGQRIVVIGYPGISQKIFARNVSFAEAGSPREITQIIPQPTVTDGIIANKGLSGQEATQGQTISTMGDSYQLTVTATGHGNSGGPVVDMMGKAIGLFTYARSRGDERVTFAVPIKYGRKLLKTQ